MREEFKATLLKKTPLKPLKPLKQLKPLKPLKPSKPLNARPLEPAKNVVTPRKHKTENPYKI